MQPVVAHTLIRCSKGWFDSNTPYLKGINKINKIHPVTFIIFGFLLCSIGFNILQHESVKRLTYQIQKLEAGPARGLFLEPEIPKPPINDEELKELMEQILKKMKHERAV